VFEGLTQTNWRDFSVEPMLAESWTHTEDGKEWTFKLRKDVKWHDGEPFTADDVIFTFQRIIYNPDIPASARPGLTIRYFDTDANEWKEGEIGSEKIDDYTVKFTLPETFAPFERFIGTAIYPKHILEKAVDEGNFTSTWDVSTPPEKIIGTGAFKIERYDQGERVIMVRNDNYWLKDKEGNSLPYLEKIIYLVVPNQEAMLLKFQSGEIDAYGVIGEHYPILKPKEAAKGWTIYKRGPGFGTLFLALNMNPGKNPENDKPYMDSAKLHWFTKKEFRQAVAHCVDRQSMINNISNGLGYQQHSPISPSAGAYHNPNVKKYDYDLEKAKAILDGIGWTDKDGDGIREDDQGRKIEFSLVTNSGNQEREKACTMVQQDLGKVGIQVHTKFLEFNSLVSQLTSSYDWEALMIGFTGSAEPHGGINFWHSSERLHLWYPNQKSPATDWEKEINELYVEAGKTLDTTKRAELYHKFQDVYAENVPVIYTVLGERMTAIYNRFGNVKPTLFGLYDDIHLYIKKK
jgi:peptide/nickel transport system substrate-binding protein